MKTIPGPGRIRPPGSFRKMPPLNWLTREADLQKSRRAPYRLLEPVPEMGYGDPAAGNLLIQGDNLDALKALLTYYAGRGLFRQLVDKIRRES